MKNEISRREFNGALARYGMGLAGVLIGCAESTIAQRPKLLPLEQLQQLGTFQQSRPSKPGLEGIVIGAPLGDYDGIARAISTRISEYTGIGNVIADGFKRMHGINVTHPTRGNAYRYSDLSHDDEARAVHEAYKAKLVEMAKAPLSYYFEIRTGRLGYNTLEIQTSGISSDESIVMKKIYQKITGQSADAVPSIASVLSIEPIDELITNNWGTKHHGTLLYSKKGFIVAVPTITILGMNEVYSRLSNLILEVVPLLKNGVDQEGNAIRQIRSTIMDMGRIEYIEPASRQFQNVVLGAPHGTGDYPTAEIVRDVNILTGIGAVVAKGFTKYETRNRRINVNRPTEGMVERARDEIWTQAAQNVYNEFERQVMRVARNTLDVYVDIHSNARSNYIEIASTGVSRQESIKIKEIFKDILRRILPSLDVLIEPVDSIYFTAYSAKDWGILRLPNKGLHIELPVTDGSAETKRMYTKLLAQTLPKTGELLSKK